MGKSEKLDQLLYNGRIYTMAKEGEVEEAIGFKDGKITFVGSSEEAEKFDSVEKLDLSGATVIPGMADAHMHMYAYCQNQTFVNLGEVTSISQLIEVMIKKAEETPKGQWIKGVNFDQNKFIENRLPTRYDLDKISQDHPILIRRCCLHAVVVNSRALELAGIDKDYVTEFSGIVEKDAQGEPNGIIREQSTKIFDYIIPDPFDDKKTKDRVVKSVLTDMHAKGVTNIHTYSAKIWNYFEDIDYYRELEQKGELGVRVTVCLDELFQKESLSVEEKNNPNRLVQQGAYKLFTDGSLGARSAALKEPYTDDPGNRGFVTCSQEELNEKVLAGYQNGLQLAIHAIGDLALEMTINAIENAIKTETRDCLPFRIIHVQLVNEELIKRMKALPVILDIQPIFLGTDLFWIEDLVGKDRLKGAYAWKRLQDEGFLMTGGSDCPVESYDPIAGIYAAVSRMTLEGFPKGGFAPEEKLSRFDAVTLFTKNPPYATGQEEQLGTLEIGKFADMVVLDRDIFTVSEDVILDTKVLHTFVAGNHVHGNF